MIEPYIPCQPKPIKSPISWLIGGSYVVICAVASHLEYCVEKFESGSFADLMAMIKMLDIDRVEQAVVINMKFQKPVDLPIS